MINMIREIAAIAAQALADEDGRLNAEIAAAKKEIELLRCALTKANGNLHYERTTKQFYFDSWKVVVDVLENVAQENRLLRRPLWVKVVAWFARHGS